MMNQLPKKMRGVYLTGHGGPDKLVLRNDLPLPRLASGDVLIRIHAAGVNNTDINTRTGWYAKDTASTTNASWMGTPMSFPRIQGADACGRIVAVGADVGEERVGERVLIEPCIREFRGKTLSRPWYFGSECDGGFAEYAAVASRHAHRIGSSLSDAELATFPCSYSTAENLLTRSAVTAKDRVLVTGASGGVGSAVVQLARARGASVVAVTSPSKVEGINALGASKSVSRDDNLVDQLGLDSIDAVIDLVAGRQWPQLLDVLAPGGRYAVAGAIGGPLVTMDIRTLYLKDLRFFGCTVLEPHVFPNLIRMIESETIRPLVADTFPLEQIAEAQKTFMSKAHIGKIVLSVFDDS
jgi:NADPH:quinone reductase-like Zn-dependent oxidoreductase